MTYDYKTYGEGYQDGENNAERKLVLIFENDLTSRQPTRIINALRNAEYMLDINKYPTLKTLIDTKRSESIAYMTAKWWRQLLGYTWNYNLTSQNGVLQSVNFTTAGGSEVELQFSPNMQEICWLIIHSDGYIKHSLQMPNAEEGFINWLRLEKDKHLQLKHDELVNLVSQ